MSWFYRPDNFLKYKLFHQMNIVREEKLMFWHQRLIFLASNIYYCSSTQQNFDHLLIFFKFVATWGPWGDRICTPNSKIQRAQDHGVTPKAPFSFLIQLKKSFFLETTLRGQPICCSLSPVRKLLIPNDDFRFVALLLLLLQLASHQTPTYYLHIHIFRAFANFSFSVEC